MRNKRSIDICMVYDGIYLVVLDNSPREDLWWMLTFPDMLLNADAAFSCTGIYGRISAIDVVLQISRSIIRENNDV